MQIRKKLLFLFILTTTNLLFVKGIFLEAMIIWHPDFPNGPTPLYFQIRDARHTVLRFAQMAYDLIPAKKELEDELRPLHDAQIASIKKFSLSRLLTKNQWKQVKKIGELENSLEPEFIEPIVKNCSFLISYRSGNNFQNELVFLEKKIFDFCNHAKLSATKVGPEEDIPTLLNNIHKMVSKIEIEVYEPSKNITTLGKLRKLLWGTSFSYEILPNIFPFTIHFAEGIVCTLMGHSMKKELERQEQLYSQRLQAQRQAARQYARTHSRTKDNNERKPDYNLYDSTTLPIQRVTDAFLELGKGGEAPQQEDWTTGTTFFKMLKKTLKYLSLTDTLVTPIVNIYKALQKDSYEAYKKCLETEIKRKQARLQKTIKSNIKFSNIIGYEKEKQGLKPVIEALTDPIKFRRFGATVPTGLLLIGPPGSGKTLFARAIAGETGCSCWSICGTDLFGDDEQSSINKIDDLFNVAELFAPSIIVIDELDFIGTRENSSDKSNSEKTKTLAKLLTKLSGFTNKNPYKPVFIIATANFIENIDPALMRSGRFDIHFHLGLPDIPSRISMFGRQLKYVLHSRKHNLDLDYLAELSEGCSFADIVNIVNRACLQSGSKQSKIPLLDDFANAIARVQNEKTETEKIHLSKFILPRISRI